MAEMIRVRIGRNEPRYLDASDGKPQALYLDVVENRRVKDDAGQWVDGDPQWYSAKFTGYDADLIRDQFEQGDALVLYGTKEARSREFEGKQYRDMRFYVDSFGIDPRLTTFSIDRSRRTQSGPTRDTAQEAAQEAAQSAIADAEEDQAARQEFINRLHQLVEGRYLAPDAADMTVIAWDSALVAERSAAVQQALATGGVAAGASLYVSSVADERAGAGRALSWNEAARQTMPPEPAQAPVAANPWDAVQQIREEVSAPAGPAM